MSNFESVKHFMKIFGQTVQDEPRMPNPEVIRLRLELILEEVRELYDACIDPESKDKSLIDNGFDLISKTISNLDNSELVIDIVEVADAITDIEYINLGTAAAFGIDIDKTFAEVHRSNMSKLGIDGKPIYRDDGKVLKGPNYSSPDLRSVLFSPEKMLYV